MTRQESGIDQLVQRIRSDGIEKANHERDQIIAKAQAEANAIVDRAREDAERLLADARKTISQEKRTMAAELELSARDFAIKLSDRMREQLFFPAIKESVRITLKEPAFLQQVLERLILDFVKTNPCNLDVLVPKELRTTLATFFAGAIFDGLDKKCDVRLVDEEGIDGFVLIKRGEHYVWDFRVDTIATELMRLIEPSLRKYFTASSRPVMNDTSKSVRA